jgi:hypothetical protein
MCTVHDIDEDDGQPLMAVELIDNNGRTYSLALHTGQLVCLPDQTVEVDWLHRLVVLRCSKSHSTHLRQSLSPISNWSYPKICSLLGEAKRRTV